jgi:predicted ATPase
LSLYFSNKMSPKLIVITGGPGTGKTTLINQLIQEGHLCYPEISREITEDARKNGVDQLFLNNSLLFSELLLEGRKKQHENAISEKAPIIFLDRGLPDVLAYMHYIGDSYPSSFNNICKELRYSKVFLLPPWEEIYSSDEYRYENFEQAKLIFNHLKETYENFGYSLIDVPKDSINNRILFILDEISKE